ncbi:hypothetical protein HEP83_21025 [Streptomyces sp. RLA2-12]|nr:hypothetical protein [Streptomyces sp. RLA2-12]QDN63512.1 hypothetical protein FNV67_19905 [Streptomyces sp. S1D4-20]QDN73563.1 hypothetical protein FNV66_19500 [Streptomyces sp. S1D4-14]QDO56155.1 hypothetical protein FNV60_17755 [Streptomyces sp. RLB3-5]QDO66054.1 hypothetical protein FNV59_19995 [Streptomyces sp. RLB1-8]
MTPVRPDHPAVRGERPPHAFWLRHRLPLLATLPVLPLYAVWWAFLATGGGDLAAQVAWAEFVARHGGSAYNLFWYGGMHTANYSLISPYLMAALGVRPVTVVSGLAATWLAAVLIARTGIRRPVGPALLASLALWCNVASGRTTFALGVALGLAACVLLTGERRTLQAAAYAALSTMASPVAGLFLVVVGAGHLAVRDRVRAAVLLVPPVVVVGATTLLFPFAGQQLMPSGRIWPPVLLGLTISALAPRVWRVARWCGVVYAVGTVLTYLIASPVGTNVERFAELFAPAALLAALLTAPGGRHVVRRVALVVALVLSVAWVGQKTVDDLEVSTAVPAWAADTHGVLRTLERLGAGRSRVEVVPARNHREASTLAPHVNLARGWNRQLDMERGRLFYDGTFSEATYRAWLDRWAVGFVVLPAGKPDGFAEAEARLVRSRPAWLEPVWSDANWQVLRVRDAVPLVSAPGSVLRTTSAEVDVRVPRPGPVTVRVAYSPWLRAPGGCLTRDGEFTRLTVTEPGEYRISSGYGPSPGPAPSC